MTFPRLSSFAHLFTFPPHLFPPFLSPLFLSAKASPIIHSSLLRFISQLRRVSLLILLLALFPKICLRCRLREHTLFSSLIFLKYLVGVMAKVLTAKAQGNRIWVPRTHENAWWSCYFRPRRLKLETSGASWLVRLAMLVSFW